MMTYQLNYRISVVGCIAINADHLGVYATMKETRSDGQSTGQETSQGGGDKPYKAGQAANKSKQLS